MPELKWEGECIEASATIVNGGKMFMFYGGSYNCTPQQIGCAVSEDIVYVNQSSETSTFNEATKFLLKKDATEGNYTITLGGDNNAVSKTFYIGLAETLGDIVMTQVGTEEVDGKYNVGYTATGEYGTLLVEKANGTYLGCQLETTLTSGSEVVLGVRINGVDSLSDIKAVNLSTRALTDDTVEVQK